MGEQWTSQCQGNFEATHQGCDVHGLVDHADSLRDIIGVQWSRVQDRYREL